MCAADNNCATRATLAIAWFGKGAHVLCVGSGGVGVCRCRDAGCSVLAAAVGDGEGLMGVRQRDASLVFHHYNPATTGR